MCRENLTYSSLPTIHAKQAPPTIESRLLWHVSSWISQKRPGKRRYNSSIEKCSSSIKSCLGTCCIRKICALGGVRFHIFIFDVVQTHISSIRNAFSSKVSTYYEYYSSRKWGSVESYHYCLDSSYLGLGRTVELIQTMIAHKEHPIPSPTEFDPTRPADQQ